jgi:predicted RNA binding protein YcfA (HicA-like mRNA interferase family)
MKIRDLERHLRGHGCVLFREGGAHTVWLNPANRKIASVPRHREIKERTVESICRQLEVPQP